MKPHRPRATTEPMTPARRGTTDWRAATARNRRATGTLAQHRIGAKTTDRGAAMGLLSASTCDHGVASPRLAPER